MGHSNLRLRDPVCGMQVDGHTPHLSVFGGKSVIPTLEDEENVELKDF